MTLDRAWTSDDREFVAANGGIADAYHSLLRTKIEGDQFIRLADTDGFRHARQIFKPRGIDGALITRDADRRAGGARHGVRFESKFGYDFTDVRDLRVGGVGFHDDKHVLLS